jgi:hypothetical protein
MLEAKAQFEIFARRLVGHRVSFTRLAANSLLIYIDCKPNENKGLTLWFEPTWHFGSLRGVLLGSRQAQVQDKKTHTLVAEPLNQLHGRAIEKVSVEDITFDLHISFEDGYWIKTFVSDPDEDESWHIRDNAKRLKLVASPAGLRTTEGDS